MHPADEVIFEGQFILQEPYLGALAVGLKSSIQYKDGFMHDNLVELNC